MCDNMIPNHSVAYVVAVEFVLEDLEFASPEEAGS